ncbi:MAG: hypothetical protein WBZ36_08355 [Candidatus Nitrosopolaris sp.]
MAIVIALYEVTLISYFGAEYVQGKDNNILEEKWIYRHAFLGEGDKRKYREVYARDQVKIVET